MDIILFFAVAAAICVTVGGLGLYFDTKKRLEELEEALIAYDRDITNNKREIRKLDRKLDQQCDRVVITHEWKEADCVRYPSQEGL